jgi:chitodextrinase
MSGNMVKRLGNWFLLTLMILSLCVGPNMVLIGQAQDIEPLEENQKRVDLDQDVVEEKLNNLQIPFIKNEGQMNREIKFSADTLAGSVLVTDQNILYLFADQSKEKKQKVSEAFIGGKDMQVKGIKKSPTKINYLKGKNQKDWKSNIPSYKEIGFGEVYDGIQVFLKAYGHNVEKVFLVEPYARPDQIAIQIKGAQKLQVNEEGQLEIHTEDGILKMTKPIAYQEIDGKKVDVAVAYDVYENQYGFTLGAYDPATPLIIDPLLASTFFGGEESNNLTGMAVDQSGNVYIVGYTKSTKYPTTQREYTPQNDFEWDPLSYEPPSPESVSSTDDVFVSKLSNDCTELLSSTYIGGDEDDRAECIVLDDSGNVYIAGKTWSSGIRNYESYMEYDESEWADYDPYESAWDYDNTYFELHPPTAFPTTEGAYQTNFTGTTQDTKTIHYKQSSFFVSKLSSNLDTILASTFIGQGTEGLDSIYAINLDSSGNVFVAGSTSSKEGLPEGLYPFKDEHDGFVCKLDNNLANLEAATFIGGGGQLGNVHNNGTIANTIQVDETGNVYVAGTTYDQQFPTTEGAHKRNLGTKSNSTSADGFVSKFSNDLKELKASTYLGGDNYENLEALAIDTDGSIYVTGHTMSPDFPTSTQAYQSEINWPNPDQYPYHDIFITKLDSHLSTIEASTFLGSGSREDGHGIALDGDSVYVIGSAGSSGYPTTDGTKVGSGTDVVVSRLDKNLSQLIASTVIGGSGILSGNEEGIDVVINDGNVYIAGITKSLDYPVTEDVYHQIPSDININTGFPFITKLDTKLTHARATDVTHDGDRDKIYGVDDEIKIQVHFNANVEVEGEPELKLNASDAAVATYQEGSGTNSLTFIYKVMPGDEAKPLNYVDTDALTLNGGSIKDMGGDPANISLPEPDSRESLGKQYNAPTVDTIASKIIHVTSDKPDGAYGAGASIPILVRFDEKVVVTGTPKLTLNTNPERTADYTEGSGTNTLTFMYNVQKGDSVARLNYMAIDALQLNDGKIVDEAGNVADLILPSLDSEDALGKNKNISIDNEAPVIEKVTSSVKDGSYGEGQEIPIEVYFSEAVDVTGSPEMTLNTNPERRAVYQSGSGTNVLTFMYKVAAGDNTLEQSYYSTKIYSLNYKTTDALALNGGTIQSTAKGKPAVLELPALDASESLDGNKDIIIDTIGPAIGYASDFKVDEKGSYGAGKTIHIRVKFDSIVQVEGAPYIALNTTPARNAVYTEGSGTQELTFTYTIQSGDEQLSGLDFLEGKIQLDAEGSIRDLAGNDGDLTLPTFSWFPKNPLKEVIVDTEAPVWDAESKVEATNITENGLQLSWSTATDNKGIAGYNVYQDGQLLGNVKDTHYTVTGLASGTGYTFSVKAYDAAGNESEESISIPVKTNGDTSDIDEEAPVWNEGAALTVSETGIHDITLTWNKEDVTDNIAVTGFKIYKDDVFVADIDANQITYKVEGLKSFTDYTFRIEAVDAAGNVSHNGPSIKGMTEFADLTIIGNGTEQEFVLEDLIEEVDTTWPPEDTTSSTVWRKYSALNSYGTSTRYAVEGIRLASILEKAGIKPGYGSVTFYTTDNEALQLTEEQINQERYYFSPEGESIAVEPVLAYMSKKDKDGNEPSFQGMTPSTLRIFFGQVDANEQTNNYYYKNIFKIVVSGDVTEKVPPMLTADTNNPMVGDHVSITFEEDQAWREAITDMMVDGQSIEGKYTVDSGSIVIDADVFNSAKDYEIVVQADGYNDAVCIQTILEKGKEDQPVYAITPVQDDIYTVGETKDGIQTMTVKNGISGLKYFTVNIDAVKEHTGNETVVFVHLRNNIQMSISAVTADFDKISIAKGGFNVKEGDIIKAYIVDDLTNRIDFNPTILQ